MIKLQFPYLLPTITDISTTELRLTKRLVFTKMSSKCSLYDKIIFISMAWQYKTHPSKTLVRVRSFYMKYKRTYFIMQLHRVASHLPSKVFWEGLWSDRPVKRFFSRAAGVGVVLAYWRFVSDWSNVISKANCIPSPPVRIAIEEWN